MIVRFGVAELDVDTQAASATLHGTLKDVANAEFPANLLQIDMLSLVAESGVAADHEDADHARQVCGQAFGHAVDEIFLLGVRAKIGEWQNDKRGFVRQEK